jgi:hypothetical protein
MQYIMGFDTDELLNALPIGSYQKVRILFVVVVVVAAAAAGNAQTFDQRN